MVLAIPRGAAALAEYLAQLWMINASDVVVWRLLIALLAYLLAAAIATIVATDAGIKAESFPLISRPNHAGGDRRVKRGQCIAYFSPMMVVPFLILIEGIANSGMRPDWGYLQYLNSTDIYTHVSIILVAGVVSPIVEEIIVRGFVLANLGRNFSFFTAIIINSILWALAHPGNWVVLFVFGLVLGYSALKLRMLMPAVISHVGYNLALLLI